MSVGGYFNSVKYCSWDDAMTFDFHRVLEFSQDADVFGPTAISQVLPPCRAENSDSGNMDCFSAGSGRVLMLMRVQWAMCPWSMAASRGIRQLEERLSKPGASPSQVCSPPRRKPDLHRRHRV